MMVAGKDISREMTRACAVCAIKPKKSLVMDWMWKLPKRRCPVWLPCSGAVGAGFFPVGEKRHPFCQRTHSSAERIQGYGWVEERTKLFCLSWQRKEKQRTDRKQKRSRKIHSFSPKLKVNHNTNHPTSQTSV